MSIYLRALGLAVARSATTAWWAHGLLLALAIFDNARHGAYVAAMFFLFGLFYLFAVDDIRMFDDMRNEETR